MMEIPCANDGYYLIGRIRLAVFFKGLLNSSSSQLRLGEGEPLGGFMKKLEELFSELERNVKIKKLELDLANCELDCLKKKIELEKIEELLK